MRTAFRTTLALLAIATALAQTPVIFDTDMGNDIDDALALAMLHTLTSRGECRLIGVTLTNGHPSAVPYVRMLNSFYGRSSLPVGTAVKTLKGGDQDGFLTAALRSGPSEFRPAESPAESSVILLRRLLAHSKRRVVIVQVGFSTNLAALLDSPADAISPMNGMDLVRRRVKLLSVMAGNFEEPKPEYNVRLDAAAARAVFDRWPTPMIVSGFEIGQSLLYPAQSIEGDFAYVPWHPVAVSYRAYSKMPYDRPTWDLTAVLAAVRPNRYFKLSPKGRVRVADDGVTRFEPGKGGRRYLILDDAARERVLQSLIDLAKQAPSGPTAR